MTTEIAEIHHPSHSPETVLYDVAVRRFQLQMDQLDKLDQKLSSVFNLASTVLPVSVALLSRSSGDRLRIEAAVCVGAALVLYAVLVSVAFDAWRPRRGFVFGPKLETVANHSYYHSDNETRREVAQELVLAFRANEGPIDRKAEMAGVCLLLFAGEAIAVGLAGALTFLLP